MKTEIKIFVLLIISISLNFAQPVKKYIESSKTKIEAEENKIDVLSLDKNKNGKVFQCPMDWAEISDKAGRCNVCGMSLKEYSVNEAKENLDKFLRISKKHKHDEMKEKNMQTWNIVCPLDGGKISNKAGTANFKGKTIGFCCEDCKSEFEKEPVRYMKNLSVDGKKFLVKK